MTTKKKCPFCDDFFDVPDDFKFYLQPSWNHQASGCCNLCDGEIEESMTSIEYEEMAIIAKAYQSEAYDHK